MEKASGLLAGCLLHTKTTGLTDRCLLLSDDYHIGKTFGAVKIWRWPVNFYKTAVVWVLREVTTFVKASTDMAAGFEICRAVNTADKGKRNEQFPAPEPIPTDWLWAWMRVPHLGNRDTLCPRPGGLPIAAEHSAECIALKVQIPAVQNGRREICEKFKTTVRADAGIWFSLHSAGMLFSACHPDGKSLPLYIAEDSF